MISTTPTTVATKLLSYTPTTIISNLGHKAASTAGGNQPERHYNLILLSV